jgi:hypothetical protein
MDNKKIEKWVALVERVIALFRPKFHNAITKVVILFGLTLSVESQVNILEAFAVASYETLFGPSEYLRSLFKGSSNPWIGATFVCIALVYNAVVTVGFELIQNYKNALPKYPKVEFELLNGDADIINDNYFLRGMRCTHSIDEIPDFGSRGGSSWGAMANLQGGLGIGNLMMNGDIGSTFSLNRGVLDSKVNHDFLQRAS